MGSLFISHSSLDDDAARDLSDRLEDAGFAALFLDFDPDRGIPAGRSWERELYGQLRRTDAVIFLATSASIASRWCFAEVSLARSLGKPVFPVSYANSARMPLLDDVQWVNMAEGDGAFGRLLAGLRRAGMDPSDSFAWDSTRPPYPGLEPFAPEDAAVFFGRQREVDRLLELLQPTLYRDGGRVVAIVGPSGSGKSSLLFAGLLPRLARLESRWLVLPSFTPGTDPSEGLVRSLAVAFAAHDSQCDVSNLRAELERGSVGLVRLTGELARRGGASQRKVLLVVDQAEELITRSGAGTQRAFLSLLGGAIAPDSPLWAVLTVRSEFLNPEPERAGLANFVDDPLLVEPLARGRLAEVIEGPARLGGIEFAPGLPERMVEETTGGDALPLLAYTLRELYGRSDQDKLITTTEYEAAGGVVGALQRTADRLLDELGRRGRGSLVLPTLLKLATVERGAEPARRALAISALDADERVIVETFTEARLLTTTKRPDGQTTVAVAHEALLRQWPPLREAIEMERSSLQMRSDLERLTADWERAGRDRSYQLRGERLAGFDAWAADHLDDLNPQERAFLDASRRLAASELDAAKRSNRRLRMLAIGLGAVLVGAVVAGVLALRSSREAESQSRLALSRVLANEADRLLTAEPDLAILVGLQSLSLARDEEPKPRVPAALISGLARQTHASRLLSGHTNQVHEVAYSPEGDTIASGSWDGTVRFWDARSGRLRGRPLPARQGKLTALAYSPDGRFLASGGADATVQVWDTRSRRRSGKPLTGHKGTVNALAYSPSGALLASGGKDGTVRLWSMGSERARNPILAAHERPVRDVEFSPDGRSLASAGDDDTARLWDVSTGEQLGRTMRHQDDVWGIAFSPGGELLASASADKTVRLWTIPSGRSVGEALPGHGGGAWEAAFSPDGKVIATGAGDGTVRLWDVGTQRLLDQPLSGHTGSAKDVDFSPDGSRIASASWDGSVRVWEVAPTFTVSRLLTGHTGEVLAVRASPNGRLLASADENGQVRLWKLPSADPVGAPLAAHQAEVSGVAFSRDGRLLATAAGDGTARLWTVPDLRPYGSPLAMHEAAVVGVAFSPDGRLVATASWDSTVRIWNVSSLRPEGSPLRHPEIVNSVAFSPNGRLVATGSGDGTARLWDVATHREVANGSLEGHSGEVISVNFSPDGRLLATASADTTARLWRVATREPAGAPLRGHGEWVWDVRFARDGKSLATAGSDGSARLWNPSDGAPVGQPLSGHEGFVYSLDFVGDAGLLATGGADQTVRLWRPSFSDWVTAGCGLVNRNLSLAEWKEVAPGLAYERTCPELRSGNGAPADVPAARYSETR